MHSNYSLKLKKCFYLTLSLMLLTTFLSTAQASKQSGEAISIIINPLPKKVKNASTSAVDFNALPIAGKAAFWAHNPLAPYQKILLVPSNHTLNLRFIDPSLAKAMKEGNILVTETGESPISWDEAKILKSVLPAPVATLKRLGVIRNLPFEFDGHPWAENLPNSDAIAIQKLFNDSLGDIPLSNIQPDMVFDILFNMTRKKVRWFGGLDTQIEKDFSLNKKPIFGLDVIKVDGQRYSDEDLIKVSQFTIDHDTLVKIIMYGREIKSLDSTTSKEKYEEALKSIEATQQVHKEGTLVDPPLIQRNLMWIPKLIKYLENSPHQYFVVVVGAAHFPSNQGILKLLADRGFTFTPFEANAPAAVTPRPIKVTTPQTEIQKKIAPAVEEKGNMLKKIAAFLDFALRADPPQLMVNGKEFNPASIRPELLNVTTQLLKTSPGLGRIKYRTLINNYIRTRNALFAEAEIKDKDKALARLQGDPTLTIDQLKH